MHSTVLVVTSGEWDLVVEARDASCSAQDSPIPAPKNYRAPNVSSVLLEKPCLDIPPILGVVGAFKLQGNKLSS